MLNDPVERKPLPVVQFGDPVLRALASEIAPENIASQEIQDLIDEMVLSLQAAGGIGLAAPQVGVSSRLFIIKIPESNRIGYGHTPEVPLLVVINPKIAEASTETRRAAEACLSIRTPDGRGVYEGVVERPERVVVQGLDRHGNEITVEGAKLLSRAMQHEIDHLDGILFTDLITQLWDLRICYPVSDMDPVFEKNTFVHHSDAL
ncbi:MAG: peptide deformylase [Chloroflexia bacterium]